MIVICDSSMVIALSLINQLHLLEEMYGGVFIPPGVYDEVVIQGRGRAGEKAVEHADFIQTKELRDPNSVELYTDTLSPQDAEVIVLAKEQRADLILTRDRGLRRRARREGIEVGTHVEFFIVAKHNGFVEAVKPVLDELRDKGLLIREGVYLSTLRQAGKYKFPFLFLSYEKQIGNKPPDVIECQVLKPCF